MSETTTLTIGDLSLCPARRTLCGPRGEIVLRPQLYAMAERLARRPGVIVSGTDLIGIMYPDADCEPDSAGNVMRQSIMLLRSAIMVLSGERVRIRTERGIGYAMEVRR